MFQCWLLPKKLQSGRFKFESCRWWSDIKQRPLYDLISATFDFKTTRGTERFSVLDWYTDLSTEPFLAHALGYNYRTPRVHTGFYRQYRGLQASIYEYIARYNPTTIFNVGHSLGGALATIASLDLSMRLSSEVNHNPVQVYNITVSLWRGNLVTLHHGDPIETSNTTPWVPLRMNSVWLAKSWGRYVLWDL